MIDSVVGVAIIATAISSLMLAVEFSERAFQEAGRYGMSPSEHTLLRSSGYTDPKILSDMNDFLQFPNSRP